MHMDNPLCGILGLYDFPGLLQQSYTFLHNHLYVKMRVVQIRLKIAPRGKIRVQFGQYRDMESKKWMMFQNVMPMLLLLVVGLYLLVHTHWHVFHIPWDR